MMRRSLATELPGRVLTEMLKRVISAFETSMYLGN